MPGLSAKPLRQERGNMLCAPAGSNAATGHGGEREYFSSPQEERFCFLPAWVTAPESRIQF
jgi:hypothetical protein